MHLAIRIPFSFSTIEIFSFRFRENHLQIAHNRRDLREVRDRNILDTEYRKIPFFHIDQIATAISQFPCSLPLRDQLTKNNHRVDVAALLSQSCPNRNKSRHSGESSIARHFPTMFLRSLFAMPSRVSTTH